MAKTTEELCKVCGIVGRLSFLAKGAAKAALQSAPYIADIVTDVLLAARYYVAYRSGDGDAPIYHIPKNSKRGYFYFTATITCLIVPWAIILLLTCFWPLHLHEAPRLERLLPLFALLGVAPLAIRFVAQTGNFQKATEVRLGQIVSTILLIEALLEALPQCMVQILVIHERNSIDWLLILGITSSLFTVAKNSVEGYIQNLALDDLHYLRFATSPLRQGCFFIIVMPWCIAFFGTILPLPPLANEVWIPSNPRQAFKFDFTFLHDVLPWILFIISYFAFCSHFVFTRHSRLAYRARSFLKWVSVANRRRFDIATCLLFLPVIAAAHYLMANLAVSYLMETTPYRSASTWEVTKFFYSPEKNGRDYSTYGLKTI